jgi:hypothetical protein
MTPPVCSIVSIPASDATLRKRARARTGEMMVNHPGFAGGAIYPD